MSAPEAVLQLIGLVTGQDSPFDGEYLLEYSPERDGVLPCTLEPMQAHIVTTPEISKARRFPSAGEAMECWRQTDPRQPLRPDGRPNRPLTAFTVEVKRAPA